MKSQSWKSFFQLDRMPCKERVLSKSPIKYSSLSFRMPYIHDSQKFTVWFCGDSELISMIPSNFHMFFVLFFCFFISFVNSAISHQFHPIQWWHKFLNNSMQPKCIRWLNQCERERAAFMLGAFVYLFNYFMSLGKMQFFIQTRCGRKYRVFLQDKSDHHATFM